MPRHTIRDCIFKLRPFLYSKKILMDYEFLQKLPYCNCFAYAFVHKHPSYTNYYVKEEEFIEMARYVDCWKEIDNKPEYKYNLKLGNPREIYRDTFHKEAFKEFDRPLYYLYCDKNKTPQPGAMYFSLLQYLYPIARKPQRRDFYFWDSFYRVKNFIWKQLDTCKPISVSQALSVMPKNTGAGFCSLKYYGERRKKGDAIPSILHQYIENNKRLRNNEEVEDYCMFAMRGHLSDRLRTKTRPVWLVSGSTVLSEMRYYQPFYDQIEKPFFKNIWITGKTSLPRLNRYLTRHPDLVFYNTDISGWDSFRASWFHHMMFNEMKKKMILNSYERKEFEYLRESAINTKVLFPSGIVLQKFAGIISGTTGTLFFNSILNTIAGLTILDMMNLYNCEAPPFSKIVDPNWLGDDFSFFSHGFIDLEKFISMMYKYFNVVFNADKCIIAENVDERKYLGYQLKDGFLHRDEKELFQSLIYTERKFPTDETAFSVSFSRLFSYLMLGGINNSKFLRYFYFYMGKYKKYAEESDNLFSFGRENIFKLLKDIWNINIPNFNLEGFRKINLELLKYCLLYGHDFRFSDLEY